MRHAMQAWASRQIEGELPGPIEAPKNDGTCDWCFERLSSQKSEFNGGIGHPECARHAYECVEGDGAMPWPVPELREIDPVDAFLRRLGREAARMGIDTGKLAKAAGRARRA